MLVVLLLLAALCGGCTSVPRIPECEPWRNPIPRSHEGPPRDCTLRISTAHTN